MLLRLKASFNMERRKLIIAGGGFAGVQIARHLDEKLFDVLLIDKVNHHMFQPLFYQVATSQLEPSSISFPLRKIFQNKKNVQIRLAEVTSVDPDTNTVLTSIGNFSYDYLVLATGCKTNFFGNEALMKNSLALKSTYDAIKIRNEVLQGFEDLLSADRKLPRIPSRRHLCLRFCQHRYSEKTGNARKTRLVLSRTNFLFPKNGT